MSATDGQQTLDGGEETDPRIEAAGKALWWRDARRTWARDGNDIARENATRLWPRLRDSYVDAARVALDAADKA